MIDLYSGTPGSGKSLHVASLIYDHLRNGKRTICNFEVNLNKVWKRKIPENTMFHLLYNDQLSPELLKEISRENFKGRRIKEDEILLVIDECQLIFNAREWQKTGRAEWLSFFSQHRKYGYHIVLIAQFDRMIDRQIRSLIEYEYVHRKISNYGWRGKIISAIALGNLFIAVKMWYPLKEKIGSEFFRANPKYYGLYDTYGDFGTGHT